MTERSTGRRRALAAVGVLVAVTGCGRGDYLPATPDPFADRGDPRRELVATVATVPAGARVERAVVAELARVMRGRIATGRAQGPLLDVDCEPRTKIADGTRVLDCLAVRAAQPGRIPIRIGSSFLVRIDDRTQRFAWCDFQRVGGEGATEAPDAYRAPARACGGGGALTG